MKFKERLDIAIRRGNVLIKNNGIFIPGARNMRSVFPGLKSAHYSAVKKAMYRNGYMLENGTWFARTTPAANSLQQPCLAQTESRHQFALPVPLAAV